MDKPSNSTLSKQTANKASKHTKGKPSKSLAVANGPENGSPGDYATGQGHMQTISEFDLLALERPVLKTESAVQQTEEQQKREWDSRTKIAKKKAVTTTIYLGETPQEASYYDRHQGKLSARHAKGENQTDEAKKSAR